MDDRCIRPIMEKPECQTAACGSGDSDSIFSSTLSSFINLNITANSVSVQLAKQRGTPGQETESKSGQCSLGFNIKLVVAARGRTKALLELIFSFRLLKSPELLGLLQVS